MIGKFYTLDYIPNKLVYVYEVTGEKIKFFAFFNENKTGIKAVRHSISKRSKKDFKRFDGEYKPIPQVQKMINEELNKKS